MNSINEQQQGDHHENLAGSDAAKKIRELADKAKTCFFCTQPSGADSKGTRPMSVQKTDHNGTLWFMSADDSHQNLDIAQDPHVKLYFQGSPHSDFLFLEGMARISKDPALIEELWEPQLRVWFTEGKNDPRISIISVQPESGYYWDTKNGMMVAALKMAAGAITGKTMDDSIEGNLEIN